ncbi:MULTISPECIES: hypothetical protein [Bacillaceae]|nr:MULTISPECIES: hypothetical protein [Bacillaceae]UOE95946.1 hypothetical protein MM271_10240 [Alkalihalobacillus sp. LMS39]
MTEKETKEWKNWQRKVLYEEYVKPELSEILLEKKIAAVNKKYNPKLRH